VKATFVPNPLDSQIDCASLAFGELRIAIAEAIGPLADFAAGEGKWLLLRLRPKRPRRSFRTWGRT
jgi:hypothetical protein